MIVEIEFSTREDGTIFQEFEINNKALIWCIKNDDFQTLDFLEDQNIEASTVSNYEVYGKYFIDELAEIIFKSQISAEQSKSLLNAIKSLGTSIWKFNRTDRLNLFINIWGMNNRAYNAGLEYAVNKISKGIDKALEPTDVSLRIKKHREEEVEKILY